MPAANTTQVGINLSGTQYWSTEYPFINRVKDSGGWAIRYNDRSSAVGSPPYVDSHGDLISLPSNAKSASFAFEVDPYDLGTTHRYVLTYTGTATISITDAKIISSTPGKVVFEVSKAAGGWTSLTASGVDHLSNMAIVREDQVALYNSGEIFNPAFIDKVSQLSTVRFMDWSETNNSKLAHWADRPQVNDRTWMGSEGGVPVETMVALANKAHTDMWINIPANADDDFVRQEMTYIRDHLDPSLHVKVEFSNEMWNWGFNQTKQALTKADQLWGTDKNHDGKIDHDTEGLADGFRQYYGYRAAQVANIANSVFGANSSQLENVFSARGGSNGVASIAAGVARAGVGTVATLFDDLSTDGYFGSLGAGNTKDKATVLGWAKSGAAGIDAAFAELEKGGTLSSDQSVNAVIAKFGAYAAIAKKYGLDLVVYEGGAALVADDYSTADRPVVLDFYRKLAADPRMGALYDKLLDGFSIAGGSDFLAFNDVASQNNPGGLWGALGSIYQTGSVRWDALTDYAAQTRVNGVNGAGEATVHSLSSVVSQPLVVAPPMSLVGTDAADTLIGGTGDDKLDGGKGNDQLTGGWGNDLYVVDSSGDKVTERADEGTDTVQASCASYTLAANVENLTYTGTGNFTGTGNDLDNVLTGGAGNDTLDGKGGADRMIGGKGDDVYYVDNVKDVVVELAGEGTDLVHTSVSYSLAGTAVENLDVRGSTAALDLTGNELDNIIFGNNAANTIEGGAGRDLLRGYGGDDVLKGGDGDDSFYGGEGNDILIGGAGRDVLRGEAGADTFVFLAVGDSANTKGAADLISDFDAADHIDLSAIDANTKTAVNDAFKFIGTGGFTGHAGELHVEQSGTNWLVMGDVNGDKISDFMISVVTAAPLIASNFIL